MAPGPITRGMVELGENGRHIVTYQLHRTTRRPNTKPYSQYDWPQEIDEAVLELEGI